MDILEQFLSFEKEHRLFDLKYKEIYYWHLIRFEIYAKIFFGEKAGEMCPDMAKKSFIKKLGFIPYIPVQIKQYFNSEKYDILLSASFIEKNINGMLIDPYTQFMIDSYDFKCNRNTLFAGNWKKQVPYGHNNALLNALLTSPRIAYKLVSGKFANEHKQHILEIVDGLNDLFSANLNAAEILKIAEQFIISFNVIMPYYKHIIKNKYRCIFISSHYDVWQFALIAAARKCNIPTVEHQHGSISRHHISYNFKDISPSGKYLPDYLFTFGEYWTKTARLPSGTTAISVGFPPMDDSLQLYKNVVRDPRTVIFYSNGVFGKEFSRLAIQFSEIAVPLGYRIIYKFHPGERLTWRTRYPLLALAPNIQFEDSAINIHEVLASAKHHVGIASTVLFEALAFGGSVYIYEMSEKFSHLDYIVQEGFAQIFNTERQLIEQIITSSDNKDVETFVQQFYKSNAKENIFNALQKIINVNENK